MKVNKIWTAFLGAVSGLLNGLFGAGGGVAVVPMLEHMELKPQKSHATSIAIILPLSTVTAVLYFINGVSLDTKMLLWLVPAGIVGALLGARFLKKIDNDLLRRIFGVIIIYSGIRNLFR